MQDHDAARSKRIPDYYSDMYARPDIASKFCDIDSPSELRGCCDRLAQPQTTNFVLDFGRDDAWCATNLDSEDIKELLAKPVGAFRSCNSLFVD